MSYKNEYKKYVINIMNMIEESFDITEYEENTQPIIDKEIEKYINEEKEIHKFLLLILFNLSLSVDFTTNNRLLYSPFFSNPTYKVKKAKANKWLKIKREFIAMLMENEYYKGILTNSKLKYEICKYSTCELILLEKKYKNINLDDFKKININIIEANKDKNFPKIMMNEKKVNFLKKINQKYINEKYNK